MSPFSVLNYVFAVIGIFDIAAVLILFDYCAMRRDVAAIAAVCFIAAVRFAQIIDSNVLCRFAVLRGFAVSDRRILHGFIGIYVGIYEFVRAQIDFRI